MAITISIQEVAGSATMTSTQIKTTVNGLSAKGRYFVRWTYSPTAHFNDAVVVTERIEGLSSYSAVKELTNLTPDTGYIIQADLYTDSVSSSNLICNDSTSFATNSLGGEFKYTSKSASVITMLLTGLPTLEYSTIAEIYVRKNSDSDHSWVLATTSTIGAGEEINVAHLFTGLSAQTYYKFKAILYRVIGSGPYMGEKGAKIKTWETLVTTLAYIPDTVDAKPFFEDVVSVPHTGKIYIKAGITDETPSGLWVHLFRSEDGEEYTDIELDSDYAEIGTVIDGVSITEDIGDTIWYKVGLVDSQHNIYAFSDPVTVTFTDVTWINKVAGEPFDLTASEVYALADAMVKMEKYRKAIGEDGTYGSLGIIWLMRNMSHIATGKRVSGEAQSVLGALEMSSRYYAHGIIRPTTDLTGTPIEASRLNTIATDVLYTLEHTI